MRVDTPRVLAPLRFAGVWASTPTRGQEHLLHFPCSERLSGIEAETMLHLGEVFSAEIYARNAIVVRDVERGKEVLKPWVSSGDSFGTFLSLLKEKYEHSA